MKLWSILRNLIANSLSQAKLGEKLAVESDRKTSDQAFEDGARQLARYLVRGGYSARNQIVESVRDYAEDQKYRKFDAEKIVASEIAALKVDEAAWPDFTDYDRLLEAIVRLEGNGVVMRQDFTCCQTCGHAEIGEEIRNFETTGRQARGYAFFHQQATESVVDGGDINFAYGAVGGQATALEIAKNVADAMRSAGLKVDWNGKTSMCVMVELDWKRRWAGG